MKGLLITRQRAEHLAQAVATLGWRSVIFPTIDIAGPPDVAALQHIATQLPSYQKIIFISPRAVMGMQPYWSSAAHGVALFAVGASTAQCIQQSGWGKATYPASEFNSEALLRLPALQQLQGEKILLCGGKPINETLVKTLEQRGAIVQQAWVYQRRLPESKTLPDLSAIDLILITSQESLRNLIQLFGEKHWPVLRHKRLLLSSERLNRYACERGFTAKPLLANDASDEAILAALS